MVLFTIMSLNCLEGKCITAISGRSFNSMEIAICTRSRFGRLDRSTDRSTKRFVIRISTGLEVKIMSSSEVVLIVGGTGGIGTALAQRLVNRGSRIALFARDPERIEQLVKNLGGANHALGVAGDAGVPDALEGAVEAVVERFGRLDGLAHCVGTVVLKPLHLLTNELFDETIHLNLKTAFYAARAALKPMRSQQSGSIVLFSTVAVQQGIFNHEGIAAAKAGIEGLVRSAAITYAKNNIRFNAIAPGMTETNLTAGLLKNDASRKFSESMHPMGRIGQPDDPAAAAAFLLSPEASLITGQILGVDGGLGAGVPAPRSS